MAMDAKAVLVVAMESFMVVDRYLHFKSEAIQMDLLRIKRPCCRSESSSLEKIQSNNSLKKPP